MNTEIKEIDISVEGNMGLVHFIINKYHGNKKDVLKRYGIDKNDLIQIGSIGLMKAAKNYDSEIGTFSTYATRVINFEIKRYFRDNDMVKFPRSCKEITAQLAIAKIDKADITLEKIMEFTGCSERVASQALVYMDTKIVSSLDKPYNTSLEGEETTLMAVLPANEVDVDFDIIYKDYLSQLTENEKLSVELVMAGLTQHEIAPILGVSQVTISRYLKRAKIKIKDYSGGELCVK